MIRLEDVAVSLPSRPRAMTVSAADIHCKAGQIVILTGRNGSGKTTLLRVAAGSVRPAQGRVHLSRPAICFTNIETQLHLRLTGTENMRLLSATYGLRRTRQKDWRSAAERAGIEPTLNRRVGKFSKGQKVRLVLAILEAHDCRSIILDEPGNGLDDEGYALLRETLARKAAAGAAIMVSSHDRRLIEQLDATVFVASDDHVFAKRVAGERLSREFEVRYVDGGSETVPEADIARVMASQSDRIEKVTPNGLGGE